MRPMAHSQITFSSPQTCHLAPPPIHLDVETQDREPEQSVCSDANSLFHFSLYFSNSIIFTVRKKIDLVDFRNHFS